MPAGDKKCFLYACITSEILCSLTDVRNRTEDRLKGEFGAPLFFSLRAVYLQNCIRGFSKSL